MAKKDVNKEVEVNPEVEETILGGEEATGFIDESQETGAEESDFEEGEMTGKIIRPADGVVESSEVQEPKAHQTRVGKPPIDPNAPATVRTDFRDPGINIPSQGKLTGDLVEVTVKQFERFRHGKEFFELYPGRTYKVPVSVKADLKAAGKLEVT